MAVTKTHLIKSTLKAAIDYICNPEKADGKLLVSFYDERRSDKGFLLQGAPARGGCRTAARAELQLCQNHRRFCSGLAADCGGVVCAAGGVETNKLMIIRKAGLQSHFLLEITALLICADMFYANVLSFHIRLRKDARGKAFCFV